jgi:hypothetical protein
MVSELSFPSNAPDAELPECMEEAVAEPCPDAVEILVPKGVMEPQVPSTA